MVSALCREQREGLGARASDRGFGGFEGVCARSALLSQSIYIVLYL